MFPRQFLSYLQSVQWNFGTHSILRLVHTRSVGASILGSISFLDLTGMLCIISRDVSILTNMQLAIPYQGDPSSSRKNFYRSHLEFMTTTTVNIGQFKLQHPP